MGRPPGQRAPFPALAHSLPEHEVDEAFRVAVAQGLQGVGGRLEEVEGKVAQFQGEQAVLPCRHGLLVRLERRETEAFADALAHCVALGVELHAVVQDDGRRVLLVRHDANPPAVDVAIADPDDVPVQACGCVQIVIGGDDVAVRDPRSVIPSPVHLDHLGAAYPRARDHRLRFRWWTGVRWSSPVGNAPSPGHHEHAVFLARVARVHEIGQDCNAVGRLAVR